LGYIDQHGWIGWLSCKRADFHGLLRWNRVSLHLIPVTRWQRLPAGDQSPMIVPVVMEDLEE
jgi:hypothetical protein